MNFLSEYFCFWFFFCFVFIDRRFGWTTMFTNDLFGVLVSVCLPPKWANVKKKMGNDPDRTNKSVRNETIQTWTNKCSMLIIYEYPNKRIKIKHWNKVNFNLKKKIKTNSYVVAVCRATEWWCWEKKKSQMKMVCQSIESEKWEKRKLSLNNTLLSECTRLQLLR